MDEKNRLEELQRKIEETRRRTLTEELVRLESFATSHVTELAASRSSEEELRFKKLLEEAGQHRLSEESALQTVETEAISALVSLVGSRAEARRLEEEELRKKVEEDRTLQEAARKKAEEDARTRAAAEQKKREEDQRRQELTRKKSEEEVRLRSEAEQRKRSEAERQRAEAERKKKEEAERRQQEVELKKRQEEEHLRLEQEARKKMEEELRRQAEEQRLAEESARRAREEEERRQALIAEEAREKERKEREQRMQELLSRATTLLAGENFRAAAAEVAKLLKQDPANAEALALEARIREEESVHKKAHEGDKPAKARGDKGSSGEQKPRSRRSALLLVVIAAGTLLIGGIVFFQVKKSVFPSTTSIAILPWSGSSSSGDENIVGSSLAEEVVRQFERTQVVNVLGFSSAYGLAHTKGDPARSAFNLGYSLLLKGTVNRSNDVYTFNLHLVDSTGTSVWEKSYTRSQDALVSLPGEVTSELRTILHVPDPNGSAGFKTAANPVAYLLFLRGCELLHRQGANDLQTAYALFDEATTQEANFNEALAAKARVIAMSFERGTPLRNTNLDDAKNYSAEAIAIDQSDAGGYIARGMVYNQLKQYKMALQQFENALQRSPNSSEAQFNKAKVHLKTGQHEEGMNALTMAFRLNPRDPAILRLIAQTYQLARATKEGFLYHETALPFVQDSTVYIAGPIADAILTDAALTLSQADRVSAALQRLITANPDDYRSIYRLARLYQVSGKGLQSIGLLASAEKLLRAEIQVHPQNSDAIAHFALVMTRAGRFPEALVLAQQALEANPNDVQTKYRLAQMYSLQMYSGKTMSVDEEIKKLCTQMLREALAVHYRFDELANGDFYNMYEYGDFNSIIRDPLK